MRNKYTSFLLVVLVIFQSLIFGCEIPLTPIPLAPFAKWGQEKGEINKFSVLNNSQLQEREEETEFFEVADFQKIVDLTNQLNVQTNSINNLYAKYKQLETYKEKKTSLEARPTTTETANKVSQITTDIANLETDISALASNVAIELTTLNNRKDTLASHINNITDNNYISYDPLNKPESVYSYSEISYSLNKIINTDLQESIALYNPDKDSSNQTNLSLAWEVSHDRVEMLDPTHIFDATKYLSSEIQTAKELATEISLGGFDTSGDNQTSQKYFAIDVLNELMKNIKNHTNLLILRSKIFSEKYQNRFEVLLDIDTAIQNTLILPLSVIVENKDQYDDNTYAIKAKSKYDYLKIPEFLYKPLKDRSDIAKSFIGTNVPDIEKITAIFAGLDKDQWENLKRLEPQRITELVNATEKLVNSVLRILPRSSGIKYKDIVADPIGTFSKVVNIHLAKSMSGKLSLPDLIEYVYKTDRLIAQLYAVRDKYLSGIFPKKASNLPCYKGFSTLATNVQVKCINELGLYLVGVKENTAMKNLYTNINYNKKNPAYLIFGSESEKLKAALQINDNKFMQELSIFMPLQLPRNRENMIKPTNINDKDYRWQIRIYNEYQYLRHFLKL